MPTESSMYAQAILWRIQLRGGGVEEWEEFAEWLARDPRHSRAYDGVALGDLELDQELVNWTPPEAVLTNDNWPAMEMPRARRRWALGGMTALAAVAALFWLHPIGKSPPSSYEISTVPGEQRVVTLAGNDTIALNGATRIRLSRKNPRFASLLSGEAAFTVTHDSRRPFVLQMGKDQLEDVGTSFNVTMSPNGHAVEVAEGALLYNPAREGIELAAGQMLTSNTREHRIILSRKPPAEMGGWRRGRLSYRSSPLSIVAADVSRSLGTKVSVQPEIATRSFTGTIEIDRNESRMVARLAQLLDVEARRDGRGWTLASTTKAKR